MLSARLQGIAVIAQTGVEPLQEIGHQVEKELARAIDLAAREIAAVEIELAVATWEAVPGIEAPSGTAPDTIAAMRVQAAVEVRPAWAVRVGTSAEQAVQVAAVLAAAVVAVAVVGGRQFLRDAFKARSPTKMATCQVFKRRVYVFALRARCTSVVRHIALFVLE
jgi:hypothetical protein